MSFGVYDIGVEVAQLSVALKLERYPSIYLKLMKLSKATFVGGKYFVRLSKLCACVSVYIDW